MKPKRMLAILMASIIALTGTGCGAQSGNNTKTSGAAGSSEAAPEKTEGASGSAGTDVPTIKIGQITNLTGAGAQSGNWHKVAAQSYIDWINDNGGIKSMGGAKIEIVVADGQSDNTQIKTATQRLLEDKEICAVMSNDGSNYTVALCPLFEKYQVPCITMNYSNVITESGYQWIFSLAAKSSTIGPLQIDYLNWLKDEYGYNTDKVALIYADTEFGTNNAKGVRATIEGSGLELVVDEAYPPDITDASALVTKIIQSGVEAVFATSQYQDAKLIFSTMKSMNFHPVVVGGGQGMITSQMIDALGDSVIGMCSTAEFNWEQKQNYDNPELMEHLKRFCEASGEPWAPENALGAIDSCMVIVDALERCGSTDRTVLRDAIRECNIQAYPVGGDGHIKFDENGLNTSAVNVVVQWQDMDGTLTPRLVYPPEFGSGEFIDYRSE